MTPSTPAYIPTYRTCTKCLKYLPLEQFFNSKNGKFGKQSRCIPCCYEAHNEWSRNNYEKISSYGRQYYQDNAVEIKSKVRMYRSNNKETYSELCERHGPEYKAKKLRQAALSKYRVNQKWFDHKLREQEGACGICSSVFPLESSGYTRPCVDHDHACCGDKRGCRKCVRGLLCRKCNIKLAGIEDIEWLVKAVSYLNHFLDHHIVLTVPSEQQAKVS